MSDAKAIYEASDAFLSRMDAVDRAIKTRPTKPSTRQTHLQIDGMRFRLPDHSFDASKLTKHQQLVRQRIIESFEKRTMLYNILKFNGSVNGPDDQYNWRFLRQPLAKIRKAYMKTGDPAMLDIIAECMTNMFVNGIHDGPQRWTGKTPFGSVADGKSGNFPAGTPVWKYDDDRAPKWVQNQDAPFMKREEEMAPRQMLYKANNRPLLDAAGKWLQNILRQIDSITSWGTSFTVFDEYISHGSAFKHSFDLQVACSIPGAHASWKIWEEWAKYRREDFWPKTMNRDSMFSGYDSKGQPKYTFSIASRPEGFLENAQTITHGGHGLLEVHQYSYLGDLLQFKRFDQRDKDGYQNLFAKLLDAVELVDIPAAAGSKLKGGVNVKGKQLAIWGHFWNVPDGGGHYHVYLGLQSPFWAEHHEVGTKDKRGRSVDKAMIQAIANTAGMVWKRPDLGGIGDNCAGILKKRGASGKKHVNEMTGGVTFESQYSGGKLGGPNASGGLLVAYDGTDELYNLRVWDYMTAMKGVYKGLDIKAVLKNPDTRESNELDPMLDYYNVMLERPDVDFSRLAY